MFQFFKDFWNALTSKGEIKPTPALTEYPLTGDQVSSLCSRTKDHVYIWDSMYYALSMEDWQTVFKDVLPSMPKYLAEKFDCEDYAFLCMTRITERYQVNTCGVAVGMSPMGYHGFNVFIEKDTDFRLHILEPQTGEIDPPGYELDTVIFG